MKTVPTGYSIVQMPIGAGGITVAPGAPYTSTTLDGLVDELVAAIGVIAAADVSIADAGGYFVGANVEAALQELAAKAIGYQAHGAMGAAETFDAATGWHSGTFDANCTFTLTGAPTGTVSSLFLELAQDGTGGWTVTLPASVLNRVALEAAQDTTAGTTSFLVLLSRDGGTTWYGGWWGGSPASTLTIEDEGTPLATDATTLDFTGAGVTASGTGASKTITIPGTPVGTAGGDLSGTYPNPIVVDDSHSHTAATAPGSGSDMHGHVDNVVFSGDGSTTVFTLPVAPVDATSVAVYVAAARSLDWTLSGVLLDTLTFGSAPPSAADNIVIDIAAVLV